MTRFFLIAILFSVFSALSGAAYSQIIVKDFQETGQKAKVQLQNVTTVQPTAKLPYVADITKLKKTADLPPEERKAVEESAVPDTMYVKQLKQKDQMLVKQHTLLKATKADDTNMSAIDQRRWFPVEKNEE